MDTFLSEVMDDEPEGVALLWNLHLESLAIYMILGVSVEWYLV